MTSEDRVGPRADSMNHHVGIEFELVSRQPIMDAGAGDAPGLVSQGAGHLQVVADGRPVLVRCEDVFERETRVVRESIIIEHAGSKSVGQQARSHFCASADVEASVHLEISKEGQEIVEPHSELNDEGASSGVLVDRIDEGKGPDDVGRLLHEACALRGSFKYEPKVGLLKIPQSPVNQLARLAAGTAGKVALLDQGDSESSHRGVSGVDVEGLSAHPRELV
jgi:hypothetical protein